MKTGSLPLLQKKVIPDSHLDAGILVFIAKNRTTSFDVAAVIFSSCSPPPHPPNAPPTSTRSTPVRWSLLPIRRAEDRARWNRHCRGELLRTPVQIALINKSAGVSASFCVHTHPHVQGCIHMSSFPPSPRLKKAAKHREERKERKS